MQVSIYYSDTMSNLQSVQFRTRPASAGNTGPDGKVWNMRSYRKLRQVLVTMKNGHTGAAGDTDHLLGIYDRIARKENRK